MRLTADQNGERLDALLSRRGDNLSRSAAQKLIEAGAVRLNGRLPKKNDRLNLGDTVEYTIPEPKEVDIAPKDIPLEIVYEDEDVAVINKPKGLVVHPAAGHQDDTLVNGSFREDRGTVDAPIGRHPTDRKKMCVTPRNSKPAVTHWEVVERFRGYTHIRCRLETGRTHQIRVHMAYIGHPILGDTVYGHKKPELGQSSQCLHAGALCFRHPRDGRPILVFAPLPDYFQQVLEKLRKM